MLKIGELAALAGTTVKSVRHYHASGLLEEPARQDNGYRVYRVQDLVRLSRIKQLRDIGLSVARIRDLLDGGPVDVHGALDTLDSELATQARLIESQRTKITLLRECLDPELPDQFAEVLAQYAAAGAPAAWIVQEREFLLLALTVSEDSSEVVSHFLDIHQRVLSEPHRLRGIALIVRMAELETYEPDHADVDALAADFCEFMVDVLPGHVDASEVPFLARANRLRALLEEHQAEHRSPGQEQFARAVAVRLASRRTAQPKAPARLHDHAPQSR